MIDFTVIPSHIWWLVAAVTIPIALLSGYHLFILDRREQAVRRRLEAFRGAVLEAPYTDPWYHQLGIWLAPIVGVVEQQRLQKALAAAGIKARGSVATFITIKMSTALFLAGTLWLALALRHFEMMMILRVVVTGFGLVGGWRLRDLVLIRLIARRRLR